MAQKRKTLYQNNLSAGMDDTFFNLTAVRKLLQRRAKRTKLFWISCISSRKTQHQKGPTVKCVCNSQTQTTPTIQKTCGANSMDEVLDVVQIPNESCVVDSSRDCLDSHSSSFMSYFESVPENNKQDVVENRVLQQCGSCHCSKERGDIDYCKALELGVSELKAYEDTILDKLINLQMEVNSLHATLASMKSGMALVSSSSTPPPAPPLPPPFPASPLFRHSNCLSSQNLGQFGSRAQIDDFPIVQEKGKPIITVEDLQKVKLRQVSSVSDIKP